MREIDTLMPAQVEYTVYKDADGNYVDEYHPQATAVRSCQTVYPMLCTSECIDGKLRIRYGSDFRHHNEEVVCLQD